MESLATREPRDLDRHFLEHSFAEGALPTQSDVGLFKALAERQATLGGFPSLLRWFRHMSTYEPDELLAMPSPALSRGDGGAGSWEARRDVICRHLQEVLGEDRLAELLQAGRRLRVYWGTSTTGRIHVGYFVPIAKIADFLAAGCEVTILLADLHAYLDNMKAPWEMLDLRTQYYEQIVKATLQGLGVDVAQLQFVRGTEYQLSRKYTMDVYRLSSLITEHDAKKAGAEVVKQVDHPLLSGLLYPGLQALDEEHLHVDAQFGGADQRKIFTFAEKYLPQLGYAKRIHLMNPLVPGLSGGKMSSSEEDSKIDLLDPPHVVKNKIKKSFCEPGNVEDNGMLSILKYILLPLAAAQESGISVARGSPAEAHEYRDRDELERDFKAGLIHPGDLKAAVEGRVNALLAPIRAAFSSRRLQRLVARAYPGSYKVPASIVCPWKVHFQVGVIAEATLLPAPANQVVLKISLGEASLRTDVVSLDSYTPVDSMRDRAVVVVSNVAPTKNRGLVVDCHVLFAFYKNTKQLEMVQPLNQVPAGAPVHVSGHTGPHDAVLKASDKLWEKVQADLTTNFFGEVEWRGCALQVDQHNPVLCRHLSEGLVK
ncbi:tyrosine--tRNA ligase, cytoplasmic [Bacillus rossius redtenbacheri]|uniref:tyrosine--tRNA ligase, cytoplasmic n=1 Tax=Bacillus rossius redtenbacheri TaxID=93214 RepID=UPI002FDE30BB